MPNTEIHVKEKNIQRTEYVIEVPVLSKRTLRRFFEANLASMNETDQWIMRYALGNSVSESSKGFKVCFRSPSDFELDNRIYFRVWDFNKDLWGETLNPLQVLCLCWAICQLKNTHFVFTGCGSGFHVVSDLFEAGKYRGCFLDITFNSQSAKPQLCIRHHHGNLFFNPTSYYGVRIS